MKPAQPTVKEFACNELIFRLLAALAGGAALSIVRVDQDHDGTLSGRLEFSGSDGTCWPTELGFAVDFRASLNLASAIDSPTSPQPADLSHERDRIDAELPAAAHGTRCASDIGIGPESIAAYEPRQHPSIVSTPRVCFGGTYQTLKDLGDDLRARGELDMTLI